MLLLLLNLGESTPIITVPLPPRRVTHSSARLTTYSSAKTGTGE
jgi:hypothetical protein